MASTSISSDPSIIAARPKRLAIITGASSGIGQALAQAFASNGYTVVNWDLQPPPSPHQSTDPTTSHAASPPQHEIHFIPCDVTNEQSILTAYHQTLLLSPETPPWVLINNAGLQFLSPIEDFPLAKWQHILDVLLTGTFLCSKVVLKDMKSNRGGRVLNISSIHGKAASPFKSAYVAAKHGVLGFAKVLALETAEVGVTVNSICPGYVDTPLMRGQVREQMALNAMSEAQVMDQVFLKNQAVRKLTSPDQVASLALWLCSDAASTVTGEAWNMSGGWGMGL